MEDKIKEKIRAATVHLRMGNADGGGSKPRMNDGKSALEQQLIETQVPANSSERKKPENNEARESLIKVLNSKAAQSEVEMLKEHKTNKHDTDMQMKCLDIMHRQVTHMVVLIIEILKQGIVTKTESETTRQ